MSRNAFHKVTVFIILERNGGVKDVKAQTLFTLTIHQTVRKGPIVYTYEYKSYDLLMFCSPRHLKIDHKKKFSSDKVYINSVEDFLSYDKERPFKHHGVSKERFPLYLK
jgi:transposase